MGGGKNQNGSNRRLFQHFEEGIAGRRIHCLGITDNYHPPVSLIGLQGKVLTEGANLIDFNERAGRLNANNVRVESGLYFTTGFAFTAGPMRCLPGRVWYLCDTIAGHSEGDGRFFPAHAFYSCKQKGVGDGPILKEGG